jgi:ATP-dependent Clp endopeptidase proteolytic subunit ClpP
MIDTPAAHRRIQALAPTNKHWFRIENSAQQDEAVVRIYDAIGMWAVTADDFVREIGQIDAKTIQLHINSPGGDVFDGLAIHNALKMHPARVVVHVDGLAASIASIIALAGDEVHMAKGSFFMIHNPFTIVAGDSRDMRKTADVLDKIGTTLASIYADATGQSIEEMQALMDDESWFNAADAKEIGFATHTTEQEGAKARFDLSLYNKVPETLAVQADEPVTPEPKTIRDAEKALRDAGFSRTAARAIATGGFKDGAEDPRDEADAPEEQDNAAALAVVAELEAAIIRARLANTLIQR